MSPGTGAERAPTQDELLKWLEAANDASAEQGLLSGHGYPAPESYATDPELADKPLGTTAARITGPSGIPACLRSCEACTDP